MLPEFVMRKNRRSRRTQAMQTVEVNPRIHLWMLRILVRLGGHHALVC